ncbi:MAG: GNAT family N-acetyltransferase [Proteobacteria bacterium]|nr:GNAT family N-acetyltransferase [Pseudomonadota bacterium]
MKLAGHGIPSRERIRIELRPLCAADEAMYCGLYTDAETMAYICPPLSSQQAACNFHAALQASVADAGMFAIVEKATGSAIGVGGWQRPDLQRCHVEIGAMLLASARNQRYSIEAVAAIATLALATLPIDTVWVQYHPANVAAGRLCDRLGMRMSGNGAIKTAAPALIMRWVERSTWQCANSSS